MMMGVISNSDEEDVVREFFELFKIPWEFYRAGAHYDVVLCSANSRVGHLSTKVLIIYGSSQDEGLIKSRHKAPTLSFLGKRLPILGDASTFRHGVNWLIES